MEFKSSQKNYHLKHFTITKPLLYLVLRVKKLTLPGKCAQTELCSRKCYFLALFYNIRVFSCFDVWRLKISEENFHKINQILNKIWIKLTSRKLTHNLKNIEFVYSLMKTQWFSWKEKIRLCCQLFEALRAVNARRTTSNVESQSDRF